MVCKKYQNEFKEFKQIIVDIMQERKNGISDFDKKIIEIEKKEFEKFEVIK